MGVVTFDYTTWKARFPELAPKVPAELAALYFSEATIYLDNTDCSLVTDTGQRTVFLNLLVAHIAALNGATEAGAQGIVGRISSVTEGSVTIKSDFNVSPGSAQWYAQTKYGAQYWQMTAQYRTMHYVPGPVPPVDPFAPWPLP